MKGKYARWQLVLLMATIGLPLHLAIGLLSGLADGWQNFLDEWMEIKRKVRK